jgi:Mrp family chromosome partitioning ATPase
MALTSLEEHGMISIRDFHGKAEAPQITANKPGFAVFLFFRGVEGGDAMTRKIVLALPNRDYAGKLAEYMRETEPGWDTAAFTHEAALRLRLHEAAKIDLLIGAPQLLRQMEGQLAGVTCVAALVEDLGLAEGVWPEISVFQPLPSLTAKMSALMSESVSPANRGCHLVTVFSASGGAGKTTTALNLVRQAGERGWRTFYLNLESLNATSRLFGIGDPDNLSRLLYGLQTEPERFAERLQQCVRHQPFLRSDFIEAPDYPGERAAMSAELLELMVNAIRSTGKYDLIVADPDSGIGDWHSKLLELSDRIVWLVTDDWQCMEKSERLLAYWRNDRTSWFGRISFVRNKGQGAPANRWNLPTTPAAVLPYISQWKGMSQPGSVLGAAAFSGAVEGLLDACGMGLRRKEDMWDGSLGAVRRGAG